MDGSRTPNDLVTRDFDELWQKEMFRLFVDCFLNFYFYRPSAKIYGFYLLLVQLIRQWTKLIWLDIPWPELKKFVFLPTRVFFFEFLFAFDDVVCKAWTRFDTVSGFHLRYCIDLAIVIRNCHAEWWSTNSFKHTRFRGLRRVAETLHSVWNEHVWWQRETTRWSLYDYNSIISIHARYIYGWYKFKSFMAFK